MTATADILLKSYKMIVDLSQRFDTSIKQFLNH